MAIGEKTRFQSARVLFYNVRHGWGRAVTGSGRKVYIPRQALIDEGVVTLESGATIEVALDELNPQRAEHVRLPPPEPAKLAKKK